MNFKIIFTAILNIFYKVLNSFYIKTINLKYKENIFKIKKLIKILVC